MERYVDFTIGERLEKLQRLNDKTDIEMAALLGVHRHTYSDYKFGTSDLRATQVKTICLTFGVSADYLILGREQNG